MEACESKPFSRRNETILKHLAFIRCDAGGRYTGGFSMFELTAAFIAAFSASIFLAHAVEAYLAE
jgi:hypothetical protein